MAISGVIDNSPGPQRLSGWAREEDSNARLKIEAHLNGELIARAETDSDRPDLGGMFGFHLLLDRPIDPAQVHSGALILTARSAEGPATPLVWYPPLVETLAAQHVGHQLAPLSLDHMAEAISYAARTVATDPHRSDEDRQAFARLERLVVAAKTLPAETQHYSEPLTYIATAPGTVSIDGVALIGHNGHIYLRAGSNELMEQFTAGREDPAVIDRAARWAALFRGRAKLLAERGIRYVQAVIPEKVSVVPDYWPGQIETPSPILRRLEADLTREPFYLSVYDLFCQSEQRIRTYRKIDTHLTWHGARLLYDAFCRSLGIEPPFGHDYTMHYPVWIGDFSDRFPGLPIVERLEMPDSHALSLAGQSVEEVIRDVPDPGHHVGAHIKWVNKAAPIDKKVLAFGNSFFEYRLSPIALSYWFSRTFREYEFVWNYDLDYALIDKVQPDIVVAQTIERFLPRVPDR